MPDDRQDLLILVTAARAELEWWRETGIETVPARVSVAPSPATAIVTTTDRDCATAQSAPPTPATLPAEATPVRPTPSAALPEPDYLTHPGVRESQSLPDLRSVIGDCQRCKLAPHRTQIVFGVGDPDADLVFVGEAPGFDEDKSGIPFVGKAGQLLTEIITKGMRIRREDVYIANIIKCRPPGNRNPEPDEIAACEPFLKRQLALLKPKAIVALGSFAAQCLLKTRTPITRLRGTWANYQDVPLMPTFHPAYLLRNPSDKRLVWQDIQKVMGLLGLK